MVNFRAVIWSDEQIQSQDYFIEDIEEIIKAVENRNIYLNSSCNEVDDIVGVVHISKYDPGIGIIIHGEIVDDEVLRSLDEGSLSIAPRIIIERRKDIKRVISIECLFTTANPSEEVGEVDVLTD